ncbi:PIN domain-containing protein [Treponema sp. OMZ 792]|uniref:PIN domain-containing protein n=2 Tax=Treponema TaxID=157 RepID=UPI002111D1B9|nr:PIN domain-containing protein [Treponema sp. OMZ 799]UTC74492.1 PIN domain-containing protein [Treponema sp. OMZ 792]UTC77233.1 PIN domain-containing protein [Treponema sp. OMZ 799]UTC80888.1 PIN domain-containing protein [Treponema sp. OMZ 798]
MSYIVNKIFIDTNILVYALDNRDNDKMNKARNILRKVIYENKPVISAQVINEFYVAATKKLSIDKNLIKTIVHNFKNMEIIASDLQLTENAIKISIESQISFWDSLIIAAAEKANCKLIISEDLNSGQKYQDISLINPFQEEI